MKRMAVQSWLCAQILLLVTFVPAAGAVVVTEYDVTGRPALLNRARETLEFIERDLLIEDASHPGFMICSHDWRPFYGPTEDCCTGCNFALLEGVFRLNELVQNGPIHPYPILVCGTLPGGARKRGCRFLYGEPASPGCLDRSQETKDPAVVNERAASFTSMDLS